jgi:FemAB-related protein (PEP-CTERM system-associated)
MKAASPAKLEGSSLHAPPPTTSAHGTRPTLEVVDGATLATWNAYILERESTTPMDTWAWRTAIEASYGLSHHWYLAKEGGRVTGALALALAKHPLFGRYLATAPFASRGGFYADTSAARDALLAKAAELRSHLGARYVNLRFLDPGAPPLPDGWRDDQIYASFRVPLRADPEVFFKQHLKSDARNQVRKALRAGLEARFGQAELLDDFWEVMSRSMKALGSPYHAKRFLAAILAAYRDDARLAVVYAGARPVAGMMLLYHQRNVFPLHAGTLHKGAHPYVGVYLYWRALADSCERGARWFDLGRSLVGSPQEHFKRKWEPVQEPLAYWYHLAPGQALPSLHQANPKYRLAIKTWQRLPLWLHRAAGPHLISGIL